MTFIYHTKTLIGAGNKPWQNTPINLNWVRGLSKGAHGENTHTIKFEFGPSDIKFWYFPTVEERDAAYEEIIKEPFFLDVLPGDE